MSNTKLENAIKLVLSQRQGADAFGRTKLMKYLYFLQKEGGMDVGTKFELYTWGPFSKEVLFVVSQMDSRDDKVLEEKYDPKTDGYNIILLPGKRAPKPNDDETKVLEVLGTKNARDLEAMSTLHLVKSQNKGLSEDKLVDWVKSLKPYFRKKDLKDYYHQLIDLGWVKTA